MPNPLLVATDGGRDAANALALAASYASVRGLEVEVVSVVEPLSDLPMALPHREELEEARARDIADRVRGHVREAVGPVDWPVHVRRGRPAPAICTTARERHARMVILGIESHGSEGNAVAVELLHLAEKPVLVAHGPDLPRTAVVGVDFQASSMRAATEVAHLLEDGVIHLVHVRSSLDFPAANVWDWGRCYDCAVDGGFEGLESTLAGLGVGAVHHHCRNGDPAEELMAAADELGADLLGIGSDGYICNDRVVVGRVARRVLAEAATPVLASPVATRLDGPFVEPVRQVPAGPDADDGLKP